MTVKRTRVLVKAERLFEVFRRGDICGLTDEQLAFALEHDAVDVLDAEAPPKPEPPRVLSKMKAGMR